MEKDKTKSAVIDQMAINRPKFGTPAFWEYMAERDKRGEVKYTLPNGENAVKYRAWLTDVYEELYDAQYIIGLARKNGRVKDEEKGIGREAVLMQQRIQSLLEHLLNLANWEEFPEDWLVDQKFLLTWHEILC